MGVRLNGNNLLQIDLAQEHKLGFKVKTKNTSDYGAQQSCPNLDNFF